MTPRGQSVPKGCPECYTRTSLLWSPLQRSERGSRWEVVQYRACSAPVTDILTVIIILIATCKVVMMDTTVTFPSISICHSVLWRFIFFFPRLVDTMMDWGKCVVSQVETNEIARSPLGSDRLDEQKKTVWKGSLKMFKGSENLEARSESASDRTGSAEHIPPPLTVYFYQWLAGQLYFLIQPYMQLFPDHYGF